MVLALLASASAMAESTSPLVFLTGRGLMVMDENQLNSLSGEEGDTEQTDFGSDFCGLSTEDGGAAIYMIYDGTMYVGFDMAGAFSGDEGMGKAGVAQVFVDLCEAFEFPFYICNDMVYAPDTDSLLALLDQAESIPEHIYDNMADFTAAVMASVQ